MIEEFTANGYGCLRDVTVKLTPLHAFIGPNDSGKSTLLRAVRALCAAASRWVTIADEPMLRDDRLIQSARDTARGLSLRAIVIGRRSYSVGWSNQWMEAKDGDWRQGPGLKLATISPLRSRVEPYDFEPPFTALAGARMVRLRPEELRQLTSLLNAERPIEFLSDRGLGLAAVLDSIRDRNEDAWGNLLKNVQKHFPHVRRLQLQVQGVGKAMAAELHDGTRVGVDELSEGFLYYLAFAAMQHFDPVAVLCVEEPENGLHPARIREVVRILRAISAAGTQVLLTTHSPLLVNELLPTEVTVLTRPKDGGTVATRLADVPLYRERIERDALLPGEFWARYCDGEFEEPMLHPAPLET